MLLNRILGSSGFAATAGASGALLDAAVAFDGVAAFDGRGMSAFTAGDGAASATRGAGVSVDGATVAAADGEDDGGGDTDCGADAAAGGAGVPRAFHTSTPVGTPARTTTAAAMPTGDRREAGFAAGADGGGCLSGTNGVVATRDDE